MKNSSSLPYSLFAAPPSDDLLVSSGISDAVIQRDIVSRFEVYSKLQRQGVAQGSTPWWYSALLGAAGQWGGASVTTAVEVQEGAMGIITLNLTAPEPNSSLLSMPMGSDGAVGLDLASNLQVVSFTGGGSPEAGSSPFSGLSTDASAEGGSGDPTAPAPPLPGDEPLPNEVVLEQASPPPPPPNEQQQQHRCGGLHQLETNMKKHAEEIRKMSDLRHIELIPLVETALAVMR